MRCLLLVQCLLLSFFGSLTGIRAEANFASAPAPIGRVSLAGFRSVGGRGAPHTGAKDRTPVPGEPGFNFDSGATSGTAWVYVWCSDTNQIFAGFAIFSAGGFSSTYVLEDFTGGQGFGTYPLGGGWICVPAGPSSDGGIASWSYAITDSVLFTPEPGSYWLVQGMGGGGGTSEVTTNFTMMAGGSAGSSSVGPASFWGGFACFFCIGIAGLGTKWAGRIMGTGGVNEGE